MEKPAIIRALETDPRLLDYAGMAMYKIREPIGSTRLTYQQIAVGKQARNRELAVNIISQVLERYPDPQGIQYVDEVKDFMAEVMYRTLAPTKAEHFPLDQRTPFARSYYREKAEAFFYDFLAPITEYARAEIPSYSLQLDSSQSTTVRTSEVEQLHGRFEGTRQIHAGQPQQKSYELSSSRNQPMAEATTSSHSPPSESNEAPADTQTILIGVLFVLVILLLILLIIR